MSGMNLLPYLFPAVSKQSLMIISPNTSITLFIYTSKIKYALDCIVTDSSGSANEEGIGIELMYIHVHSLHSCTFPGVPQRIIRMPPPFFNQLQQCLRQFAMTISLIDIVFRKLFLQSLSKWKGYIPLQGLIDPFQRLDRLLR